MDYEVSTPVPGSVVEAVSPVRLPFEPRGWLVDFRRDLTQACRTLTAGPDQVLHAAYSSADRRLSDIENVLSYNLGTGALRAAAAHGLILERSFTTPPTGPHHYRYELVLDSAPWRYWRPSRLLADLTMDAPLSLFTEPKAGRWWLAARRGEVTAQSNRSEPPEAYALSITVSPPAGWRGSLSGLIKPLADGVVSALHNHADPVDQIVDRASSIDPTLTTGELTALLARTGPAPLGTVRLLTPRGAGVQWLPADDGIVALDIRITSRIAPGTVKARAHLVEKLPQPRLTVSM
ncbi:hypothetical protein [Pseudonocardia sp.]|uniref:hypothetical protein n=1 Tax=Pseudonocardia sp. TaxID=60912 RepID=UPI0026054877|nr:hypothetical protein [Pseudonocardia sp.]